MASAGTASRTARRRCRSAGSPACRRGSPRRPQARVLSVPPPRARVPVRSGVIRTSSYPSARSARATRRRLAVRRPRARASVVARAARARAPRAGRGRRARRAAPSRAPPAGATASSSAWTYGGFETTRSQPGPPRRPRSRPRAASTSRPRRSRVLARERERVRRDVDGGDARIRLLVRDRERDRAAAGADVEHARRVEPREQREAALDDDLRLGPRHERARVGSQRQPPEAPLAEDVRERLAPRRAARRAPAPRALGLVERPVVLGVELDPREPERVREQQLGVEPRRLDALVAEVLGGRGGGPRRASRTAGQTPAASSARRRSSAVSASVNSSRSPSRIRSSWCTVSLIRWSVTRFSGKL